jgi:hypothetical protein
MLLNNITFFYFFQNFGLLNLYFSSAKPTDFTTLSIDMYSIQVTKPQNGKEIQQVLCARNGYSAVRIHTSGISKRVALSVD